MFARSEPERVEPGCLEDLPDEQLILLLKHGNDDALGVLLRRHAEALYRFCRYLMPNEEDAEDICQESMARALTRVHSLQSGSAFRSWLFSIARNLSVDSYRSRKRIFPLPDEEITPLPLYHDGPHELVELAEEHRTVAQALAKLAKRHQEVLVLREVHGLSYAEIARQLDVSQSAVETLLFRARRRLREEYSKTAAPIPLFVFLSRLRGIFTRLAAPISGASVPTKVIVTAVVVGGAVVSEPHAVQTLDSFAAPIAHHTAGSVRAPAVIVAPSVVAPRVSTHRVPTQKGRHAIHHSVHVQRILTSRSATRRVTVQPARAETVVHGSRVAAAGGLSRHEGRQSHGEPGKVPASPVPTLPTKGGLVLSPVPGHGSNTPGGSTSVPGVSGEKGVRPTPGAPPAVSGASSNSNASSNKRQSGVPAPVTGSVASSSPGRRVRGKGHGQGVASPSAHGASPSRGVHAGATPRPHPSATADSGTRSGGSKGREGRGAVQRTQSGVANTVATVGAQATSTAGAAQSSVHRTVGSVQATVGSAASGVSATAGRASGRAQATVGAVAGGTGRTPNVPAPKVPTLPVPTPKLPTVAVPTPRASAPKLPTVPAPKLPTPAVPVPKLPTPTVTLPKVPAPKVPSTPALPKPTLPALPGHLKP